MDWVLQESRYFVIMILVVALFFAVKAMRSVKSGVSQRRNRILSRFHAQSREDSEDGAGE